MIPAILAIAALALFAITIRDAWQAFTVERARFAIFDTTYRPAGRAKEL